MGMNNNEKIKWENLAHEVELGSTPNEKFVLDMTSKPHTVLTIPPDEVFQIVVFGPNSGEIVRDIRRKVVSFLNYVYSDSNNRYGVQYQLGSLKKESPSWWHCDNWYRFNFEMAWTSEIFKSIEVVVDGDAESSDSRVLVFGNRINGTIVKLHHFEDIEERREKEQERTNKRILETRKSINNFARLLKVGYFLAKNPNPISNHDFRMLSDIASTEAPDTKTPKWMCYLLSRIGAAAMSGKYECYIDEDDFDCDCEVIKAKKWLSENGFCYHNLVSTRIKVPEWPIPEEYVTTTVRIHW